MASEIGGPDLRTPEKRTFWDRFYSGRDQKRDLRKRFRVLKDADFTALSWLCLFAGFGKPHWSSMALAEADGSIRPRYTAYQQLTGGTLGP
jgi:hypothetical protein